jgi:hypothetical protein
MTAAGSRVPEMSSPPFVQSVLSNVAVGVALKEDMQRLQHNNKVKQAVSIWCCKTGFLRKFSKPLPQCPLQVS